MRDKIKVLFLAADPFRAGARLELGEELRAIDHAIQLGGARDTLELVSHFATRTRDLQNALLRHEPQIVHFAGHGSKAGVIYLGDEHGEPRAVDKDALGRLFGILAGEVRAVVLNGCHTLAVVEVLSQVVDYAIGTNRRISDVSAIGFAEAFYAALAFGRDVQQAFDLAVNQLMLDGCDEAEVPVLRVRPGATAEPLLPAADRKAAAGWPGTAGLPIGGFVNRQSGQMNVMDAADVDDSMQSNDPAGSMGGGQVNVMPAWKNRWPQE
jgi:hypothetical protein